ncbi:MAG: DNA (cytosine-5-)-methyltransferase [Candidatus Pacebacteria bacterium]|nr:DNA (cytosine-5-)-methyltransferase [Candidatus Paceibacterota bacterium]MDD5356665.1 DNA (cytosine-5-)-methyltransferase [Candidatus Paceibacterota bacterium]
MKKLTKKIRVAELFAGVGGFRIGLQQVASSEGEFDVVWSNQWEPATKTQHASNIYVKRFGVDGHSNEDIATVPTKKIPEHDLLVGGFPCQDYSVARTLSQAAGLQGKKGILWWSIHRILKEKGKDAPSFLMLENVDRLLKSPASQRGRDFGVMLASLSDLGYAVEWRVINAADYGMPQRRRRIYILGYKKGTGVHKDLSSIGATEWLTNSGVTAKAFPIEKPDVAEPFEIEGDLSDVTKDFNKEKFSSPFGTSGVMINRKVWTFKAIPKYKGKMAKLKDYLEPDNKVPEEYFIDEKSLKEWKYLKGGKKEKRKTNAGFEYEYSEGPMAFPDALDKPSRTIVTGEGGPTPSRFKHIIQTRSGKFRRLTPIELERLNMFPDGHTEGESAVKRAFFMGNALVVGVIERLGKELLKFSNGNKSPQNSIRSRAWALPNLALPKN